MGQDDERGKTTNAVFLHIAALQHALSWGAVKQSIGPAIYYICRLDILCCCCLGDERYILYCGKIFIHVLFSL